MDRPSRIRSKSKSSTKSSKSNKRLESQMSEHLLAREMVKIEQCSAVGMERELNPCPDNDAIQRSKSSLGENVSFDSIQAEEKNAPQRKDSPSSKRSAKKIRRQSKKSVRPPDPENSTENKDVTVKIKKITKPSKEDFLAECKAEVANGEDELLKRDLSHTEKKRSVSTQKKSQVLIAESKNGTSNDEHPESGSKDKMGPQKGAVPKKRKCKINSEAAPCSVGIRCEKGNKINDKPTEEHQKKDVKKQKARPLPQRKSSTMDNNDKTQKESKAGEHTEKIKITKDMTDGLLKESSKKCRNDGEARVKCKIIKHRKDGDQEKSKVPEEKQDSAHKETNKMSKNKEGEHRIDSKVSKNLKDGEFRERSHVVKDRRPKSENSEERAWAPTTSDGGEDEKSNENGQKCKHRKGGKSRGHQHPEDLKYRKTKKAKGNKKSKKTTSEKTVRACKVGDLKDQEHGQVEKKQQLIQHDIETEDVESYGIEGVDYNIVNGVIIPKLDLSFLDDSPSSSPTFLLSLISFSSSEPEEPEAAEEVLNFGKKCRRRWRSFKKSIARCCCITYEED